MSKHYEEMSARERDAWAQEYIFKRSVRWFPCWRDDGVWQIKAKDHPPELDDGDEITEPCFWPEYEFDQPKDNLIYWDVVPSYSTDVSADYEILKKVHESWTGYKLDYFWVSLDALLGKRWQADNGDEAWPNSLSLLKYYRAGDNLHAAWLAELAVSDIDAPPAG